MCESRQPENGADSQPATVEDILRHPENYSETLVSVARWVADDGRETVDSAYAEERARHAVVTAYRVTLKDTEGPSWSMTVTASSPDMAKSIARSRAYEDGADAVGVIGCEVVRG